MSEQSRETVLDKLTKLLRLSKSSNQHEAELAMRKANEIMEKNQIAFAEVLLRDATEGSIIEEYYIVEGQRMKLLWVHQLARACAKMFDGDAIKSHSLHKTDFYFVGYPKDILAMKMLFEHLYQSWFGIVEHDLHVEKDRSQTEDCRTFEPRDTMRFKQGHGSAYAQALFWRCYETAETRKVKVKKSSSNGRDLVILKDKTLDDFGKAQGYVSSKSNMSTGNSAGRVAGERAGKNAALGGAIKGGNKLLGSK